MDQLMDQSFLKNRPEISDFVIIIADQQLNVHKSVLMSSSQYFSALFNSSMIETKTKEITLKDSLLKPFMIVLSLAYDHPITDDQWFGFQIQDMFESTITANKYQFLECERLLSHKLIDIFDYELNISIAFTGTSQSMSLNIWEVLEMAKLHNLKHLIDSCLTCFDENISHALNTIDKQYISGKTLLDVITRGSFRYKEYNIYQMVKKWIHKYRNRLDQKMVNCVLDSILLNHMSLDELNNVKTDGLYDPQLVDVFLANHSHI